MASAVAIKAGEAYVALTANDKGLKASLAGVEKRLKGFAQKMEFVNKVFTGLGAAALAANLGRMIDWAAEGAKTEVQRQAIDRLKESWEGLTAAVKGSAAVIASWAGDAAYFLRVLFGKGEIGPSKAFFDALEKSRDVEKGRRLEEGKESDAMFDAMREMKRLKAELEGTTEILDIDEKMEKLREALRLAAISAERFHELEMGLIRAREAALERLREKQIPQARGAGLGAFGPGLDKMIDSKMERIRRFKESVKTPFERAEEEVRQLDRDLREGLITLEEYQRRFNELQDVIQKQGRTVGFGAIGGALERMGTVAATLKSMDIAGTFNPAAATQLGAQSLTRVEDRLDKLVDVNGKILAEVKRGGGGLRFA